jgi:hypothetical protein
VETQRIPGPQNVSFVPTNTYNRGCGGHHYDDIGAMPAGEGGTSWRNHLHNLKASARRY